ncbi:phage tail protein [Bacillus thuringiensis serovar shandongiensis]|uniref:phage distal tail protein n=1 Tax=Bacillus toyonensis TaxID=155322 RepID=UPI000B4412E4|nr:phage tail domain-containing protein [Bacillus toyonensis]MEC2390221.1 phage tail family protein [Bacillus toyonensis]OTX32074.1 phage tail protein [Bacillus thuringiensis serovar malayensis]OUB10815.1 phage tail protein [Bacillus thuringiensis serovar shandongiensis]
MKKHVVIENRLGEKIEFGPLPPYVLVSIDLSGSEADIVQTKGYMQDGITAGAVTMRAMQYPIEFYMESTGLEGIYQLRKNMNRILNPKLGPFTFTITLPHGTFQNQIMIESLPKYREEDEKFLVIQQGIFHIFTPDPYWKGKEIEVPLVSWEPRFAFPFSFPPNVILGVKGEQKVVKNEGDEDTPCVIDIYGPCTNPIITNQATNEFIKINREIQAGQRIEINTAYGQKTVEIVLNNGVRRNAYNWIAYGSTLFSLQRGTNVLMYESELGKDSATVIVCFRERFIGL